MEPPVDLLRISDLVPPAIVTDVLPSASEDLMSVGSSAARAVEPNSERMEIIASSRASHRVCFCFIIVSFPLINGKWIKKESHLVMALRMGWVQTLCLLNYFIVEPGTMSSRAN